MFKNFIRFTDSFSMVLDQQALETKKRQDFFHLLFPTTSRRYRAKPEEDASLPRILGVRIAATHSGKVTENNGFYLPDKMNTGTSSWLEPFPKPILLHHEKTDDAVGRVKNAKYVDISEGVRKDDGWIKRADKIVGDMPSDRLIDAFIAGQLSAQESVDVVRNVFVVKDFNYTKNAAYPGLGYIELSAAITDPDAVRKVLDERFLTGSIGARSDAAVCSVCKKDWVKGDNCDHIPGKEYDGILCVIVAGNLLYDEYSYVNRPADQQSRNLEIFVDGEMKDSISLGSSDKVPEICYYFDDSITEFKTLEGDKSMDKEAILELLKALNLSEDTNLDEMADKLVSSQFAFSAVELSDEDKRSELTKAVEKIVAEGATKDEKKQVEQEAQETEKEQILNALQEELGEEYQDLVGENPDDSDILYAQQVADIMNGRVEEMTEEEVKDFLDAKLSSKKRKGLPSSSFCGPDRSFPVNDCAHYTAALRLLSRYKGPGSKSSIRACITRKGKRLGCDSASKKKDAIGDFVPEYFDTFDDEQVAQMFNGLNKVLQERDLECDACAQIQNDIDTLRQENTQLKAQLEDATGKQQGAEETNQLKKELADTYKDLEIVRDQLVEAQKQNRYIRASHLVAYQILSGEGVEDTAARVEELVAKSDEELTALEDQIRGKVDLDTINKMLNDGLANNPQGGVVVDNPALAYNKEDKENQKTEDGKQKDKGHQITKEFMQDVVREYIMIRCQQGQRAAEEYLDSLKERGLIPKEMPVPNSDR
jgi:ribosomal protein L17